jgi:ABC-type nitrate/sulfonate/bicarbonate transport system substrate-binding protein
MSLADIKGKTVVVDAINTAYAFQLYEMLRQKGLDKGDYQVNPVGATTQRLEAMTRDKAMVAAMMNPPFSIRAEKAGLKSMGTAAAALGAYQGLIRVRVARVGPGERRYDYQISAGLYRRHALDAQHQKQA